MLKIFQNVSIPEEEVELSAIRAQGAGGQNVNKVSSAIHLRFDISASSLPNLYKQRLFDLKDRRISKEGVIIIKAQRYRAQEKNRDDAIERLRKLIQAAAIVRKKRKPTKATKASHKKRLDSKARQGKIKLLRKKVASNCED